MVVKMVKENVDALCHVIDLWLEALWCNGSDSGNFRRKEIEDWLSVGRNV